MALFKLSILICLFRRGVDDVPNSFSIFTKTLLIYFFISALLKALIIGAPDALILTGYELGLMFAFIFVLLLAVRQRTDFLKTMTTLFMCESVIACCALPLTIWLSTSESSEILIPFYSHLVFIAWGLAVIGYILQQILVKEISFGLKIACFYLVQIFAVPLVIINI